MRSFLLMMNFLRPDLTVIKTLLAWLNKLLIQLSNVYLMMPLEGKNLKSAYSSLVRRKSLKSLDNNRRSTKRLTKLSKRRQRNMYLFTRGMIRYLTINRWRRLKRRLRLKWKWSRKNLMNMSLVSSLRSITLASKEI